MPPSFACGNHSPADVGAAHAGGAPELHDLALAAQEVELSRPVVAHAERAGIAELDIAGLLPPVALGDDGIDMSQGLEVSPALIAAEGGLLSPGRVELAGGGRGDKAIAKRPCPPRQRICP